MSAGDFWIAFGGMLLTVAGAIVAFLMRNAALVQRVDRLERDLEQALKVNESINAIMQTLARVEVRIDQLEYQLRSKGEKHD